MHSFLPITCIGVFRLSIRLPWRVVTTLTTLRMLRVDLTSTKRERPRLKPNWNRNCRVQFHESAQFIINMKCTCIITVAKLMLGAFLCRFSPPNQSFHWLSVSRMLDGLVPSSLLELELKLGPLVVFLSSTTASTTPAFLFASS